MESYHSPWVRVIVVNYNCRQFLQPCIDSLATQTITTFEAIVVDNCSSDSSADALRLPDARFRLVRNCSNIGFAAANNLAARSCKAQWIATLNPDAVAACDWLEQMQKATRRYPNHRMFGATLLSASNPSLVDGFGDVLSIAGIPWRGGHGHQLAEIPNHDIEAFSPCAAAALYDRVLYENIGGFDESFFCYVEDVDLGFRARLLGERCMQIRNAIVFHHGSAVTGRESAFTIFHSYRNRLWLIRKNMPLLLLLISVPANLACSLIIIARNAWRFSAASAILGIYHGLTRSPGGAGFRERQERLISLTAVVRLLAWSASALRKRSVRAVQLLM